MIAVDTNILIYAIDPTISFKYHQANGLLTRIENTTGRPALPMQVAGEFLAYLRRHYDKQNISQDEVDEYVQWIIDHFDIFTSSTDILKHSIRLSREQSLSHWDSMLIAACHEAGVTTLYSEDMQHQARYGQVTVINPFV